MSRRAFVISPIGMPNSPEREHADDVFKFIIKPAMDELGIEPIRSDHLTEPGTISKQMFREILNDDLCIALLTGRNPNVYYELAVAQAHARPVILLAEASELPLPFDVSDYRVVAYTMRPTPLIEGVYAREVADHVRSLEANDWHAPSPFGEIAVDNGGIDFHGQSRLWPWAQLLEETESTLDLMGLALRGWRNQRTRAGLLEKARGGCRVRVLVVDPENPALRQSINDALAEESFDLLCRDIGESVRLFRELAEEAENIEVRTVRVGLPHMQIARNEAYAAVIPYLFSENTGSSPLLRCASGHGMYTAVVQEVDTLWEANRPTL